jgi:tetratricopeptide (TPR) repeat protein
MWESTRDGAGFARGLRAYTRSFAALVRVGVAILCAFGLQAQEGDPYLVRQATPESQFLDLVDLVAEPKKQLELLDAFQVQFPKYEGMATVDAQLQDLCVGLELWDRALTVGAKLLALDDGNIEAVRLNLKAAEGKKDAALIAKWSERLKQLEPPEGTVAATSTVRLPFVDEEAPADLAAVDLSNLSKPQKARVEAILFNRALEESVPKRRIELLKLFERQFPSSAHLTKIRYLFFSTFRDMEDHANALTAAEAVIERDKTREDVLFYAAQHHFLTKKDLSRVVTLCTLLVELMSTKPKPDEMTDEEWRKQKTLILQQSHWMSGSIYVSQERWDAADKQLHAALQYTQTGSELHAAILSNLGWANHKMRKIPEALRFYKQCAAFPNAFQNAAQQSIVAIKSEYSLQ